MYDNHNSHLLLHYDVHDRGDDLMSEATLLMHLTSKCNHFLKQFAQFSPLPTPCTLRATWLPFLIENALVMISNRELKDQPERLDEIDMSVKTWTTCT
uniref:Uncharacterized protein n=1 Tax=Oryza barthii TaxID=65489 RepID=A0A0D3GDJ3_9ORYZ